MIETTGAASRWWRHGTARRSRSNSLMSTPRVVLLLVIVVSAVLCVALWGSSGFQALHLLIPICVAFAVASIFLIVSSARSDEAPAGIATLCMAIIGVVGIAIPAEQLVAGQRASILALLGVHSPNVVSYAPRAGLVYLLCMCALASSEMVPLHFRSSSLSRSERGSWESPRLYSMLLLVGLVTTVAFGSAVSSATLATRGQVNGNGVVVVLQQCYLLAIVVGIGKRHWGSRWLAIVSGATLLFTLAYTGSRSGLLVVATALGVRWLQRIRSKGLGIGALVGAGALGYLAAVFIVGFRLWRDSVQQQGHGDLWTYLGDAAANPIGQLASQGALDTFDGLVLSLNVNPEVVGATIFDPLRAIIGLIPSQVWPDKPGYLGPEVTHYYTDFGGQAGIFLSGPGYAYIVEGGVLGAVAFFAVLGVLFRVLSTRFWFSSAIFTIVLYTMIRFIVGGDSFDFQYGIALTLSLGIGRALSAMLSRVEASLHS